MCDNNVRPEAEQMLADLLTDITAALCAERGVDPALVVVGPVDFGGHDAA